MEKTTKQLNQENHFYNYTTKNIKQNAQNNHVSVKMSVDLLKISIDKIHFNNVDFYSLFNEFRNLSVKPSEFRLRKEDRYSQHKKYYISFNNKEHEVFALNCPYAKSLPVVVIIHEPTKQLLQHLQPYLNRLKHKISEAEFTLDFIGEKPSEMYQFFKQHLLLSNPGKNMVNLNYETSFYRNDIWKARGKGLKCYWKKLPLSNGEYVQAIRVELTMKRQLFKSKSINKISDFLSIGSSIPCKYLLFKEFNFNLFTKRMKEIGHGQMWIDTMITAFKNDIKNGYLYESNKLARTFREEIYPDYLKLHDFHQYFREVISGKSFVNGSFFSVDAGKMTCS